MIIPALLGASVLALPSVLAADRLETLPHGLYVCSLPGDAGGPAWKELPERSFTIANASTYRSANGSGIYLLRGDRLTFTRGPLKGMRFDRTGTGTLVAIDDEGQHGRLRCVRGGGGVVNG